jgi:hypothetical protein
VFLYLLDTLALVEHSDKVAMGNRLQPVPYVQHIFYTVVANTLEYQYVGKRLASINLSISTMYLSIKANHDGYSILDLVYCTGSLQ